MMCLSDRPLQSLASRDESLGSLWITENSEHGETLTWQLAPAALESSRQASGELAAGSSLEASQLTSCTAACPCKQGKEAS